MSWSVMAGMAVAVGIAMRERPPVPDRPSTKSRTIDRLLNSSVEMQKLLSN